MSCKFNWSLIVLSQTKSLTHFSFNAKSLNLNFMGRGSHSVLERRGVWVCSRHSHLQAA